MNATEAVVHFSCRQEQLIGILHKPDLPGTTGVLIVTGGPQYRVGSHRQFVLLARHLAHHGIAAFRFDYRGMGDSTGTAQHFDSIEVDIRSAIDAFSAQSPGTNEFVLWGLCDAATASAFYAHQDPRVTGLVLANPWVRSTRSQAQTHLKHYFPQRLRQAEFWKKLVSGKLNPIQTARSFLQQLRLANAKQPVPGTQPGLSDRMLVTLQHFEGRILLLLSGNDLTASEFAQVTHQSNAWRELFNRQQVSRAALAQADHTFSSRIWRDQVADLTLCWLLRESTTDQNADLP